MVEGNSVRQKCQYSYNRNNSVKMNSLLYTWCSVKFNIGSREKLLLSKGKWKTMWKIYFRLAGNFFQFSESKILNSNIIIFIIIIIILKYLCTFSYSRWRRNKIISRYLSHIYTWVFAKFPSWIQTQNTKKKNLHSMLITEGKGENASEPVSLLQVIFRNVVIYNLYIKYEEYCQYLKTLLSPVTVC